MQTRTIILCLAAALALASCSNAGKSVTSKSAETIPVPDAAQADSICRSLLPEGAMFTSAVTQEDSGPGIICFQPLRDTCAVRVIRILPDRKTGWHIAENVRYPVGMSADLTLKEVSACTDTVSGGVRFFSYETLREGDGQVMKSVNVYGAGHEHQALSFLGKRLADGRIEGQSDETFVEGMDRPEMQWASARLHSDESLVFISKADLMTDQAIEWWLSKNPAAQGKATRIYMGQLDPECSLVSAYLKAAKEDGGSYRAALFDLRGYTVVVAYNKKSGSYSLAWAEPVCTDRKNGRLLNSIYFSNQSNLTLFYYKGKTTFKYILNLANGSISRR